MWSRPAYSKRERKPTSSIMQHLILNRGTYLPSFHSRVAGFMMPNNSLFVTALGLRSL